MRLASYAATVHAHRGSFARRQRQRVLQGRDMQWKRTRASLQELLLCMRTPAAHDPLCSRRHMCGRRLPAVHAVLGIAQAPSWPKPTPSCSMVNESKLGIVASWHGLSFDGQRVTIRRLEFEQYVKDNARDSHQALMQIRSSVHFRD